MSEEIRIPTDAEHRAFIKKIWLVCLVLAVVVFLSAGATTLTMFLTGHDSRKIIHVSTAIFQIIVMAYGMGFFVPAFLTSLLNLSLGLKMSRKGLEVGDKTAGHIDRLQEKLSPIADNLSQASKEINEVSEMLRREVERASKQMDRLIDSGDLDAAVKAIKQIPGKLDRLSETGTKKLVDSL